MRPVEACYEDGLLKPSVPLPLRPGERVSVIVVRHPDARRWDLSRLAMAALEDSAFAEQGLADWAKSLDDSEGRS